MVDRKTGLAVKEVDVRTAGKVYEFGGKRYLYFPLWTLNSEGKKILRGNWWSTEQVKWKAVVGDEKRLREKYGGELKYGEMAWKEVKEMLIEVYGGGEKIGEMLEEAEKAHKQVYEMASQLPENKKPVYHNIGSLDEADGHGVQVALGMVRDLCGREKGLSLKSMESILENLELEKGLLKNYAGNKRLTVEQLGIAVKSAFAHDEDWLEIEISEGLEKKYKNSDDWGKKRIRLGLIYKEENNEDLDRITDLICLMSYGKENKDSVKKGFSSLVEKWGIEQAGLCYSTFRKMDLAQILDAVYLSEGVVGLGFDFTAVHPEYFVPWPDVSSLKGDPPVVRIEPSARFLRFALERMTEEGFLEFYGPDKELLKKALENLEKYVEKIDGEFFEKQYLSIWKKRGDKEWVRKVKEPEEIERPSTFESP